MQIGVVIGRFQVDTPHEGQRYLIETAIKHHGKVIVLLGCPALADTRQSPLDFMTRERMIKDLYPSVSVLPVHDMMSDQMWSAQVDSIVTSVAPNATSAILYGGRDSFAAHYFGKYKAVGIDLNVNNRTGTDIRAEIGRNVRGSTDFRAGVIYAKENAFPRIMQAVDIVVWRMLDKALPVTSSIVLGRKTGQECWRLPGGFVEPSDASLESAAYRELGEECRGLAVGPRQYIGSLMVNDWRLNGISDTKIMSAIFLVRYAYGPLQPGDDLYELRWATLDDLNIHEVVEEHRVLVRLGISAIRERENR